MKLRAGAGLVLLSVMAWHCLSGSASAGSAGGDVGELAAPCASCHRADGRNSGIPAIVGMNETRIVQRMAAFRQQTRGDQIMHVVASSLTPGQIAALAHYFATRPTAAAQQ